MLVHSLITVPDKKLDIIRKVVGVCDGINVLVRRNKVVGVEVVGEEKVGVVDEVFKVAFGRENGKFLANHHENEGKRGSTSKGVKSSKGNSGGSNEFAVKTAGKNDNKGK